VKRSSADEARDLPAIAARRRALEDELAEVNRTLGDAGEDPLANLRIAAPCPASWAGMVGDDVTRFCTDCKKNVTNISAMTRDEAAMFLAQSETSCVRFFRRADGTVLHGDCSVGQKRRRVHLAVVSVVGAAGAAVMAAVSQANEAGDLVDLPMTPGTQAQAEKQESRVGLESQRTRGAWITGVLPAIPANAKKDAPPRTPIHGDPFGDL